MNKKLLIRLAFIILAGILLLGYTLPLDKYGIELPKSIQ
jgi:hypothetical protein